MAKRSIDGVGLGHDEHFSIMDDVLGDVEKVKQILNKLYEDSLKLVIKVDEGNRRDAIILAGHQIEGIELLKTIWKV